MNGIDLGLLAYPFLAGLIVLSTHVPLGRTVLGKGIIFIDLAIAQVAALGVVVAHLFHWAHVGEMNWVTQASAAAAMLASAVLTWSGRRWPHLQEALIGMLFVFAACLGILLLAHNPQGGEHLKDLLAGQILWVGDRQLLGPALLYMPLIALLLVKRERLPDGLFYLVFALAITASVQLVGVFLVFSSLIAPAVASHRRTGLAGWLVAYGTGIAGYALGLTASALFDLPAGPAVAATLCVLALLGLPGSHADCPPPDPSRPPAA